MSHQNTSAILPSTTHVYLTLEQLENNHQVVRDWLTQNANGRVDAFAYESDDPLDHQSLFAVIAGSVMQNIFHPTAQMLLDWADHMENNEQVARVMFAFENHSAALLFKLTFGGSL